MKSPHVVEAEAALNQVREDLRMAREHFATFSPERMKQPWGLSGRTPEGVLKHYEETEARLKKLSEKGAER